MLIPFLALLQAQQGPMPLPNLTPSADPWFQTQVRAAIQAINKREYAAARDIVGRLPSKNITVQWDASAVPADQKVVYATARDRAFKDWEKITDIHFKVAKTGDIKVSFSGDVLRGEDGVDGAPSVIFRSMSPTDPLLESVIAMKRGEKRIAASMADIQNEVAFAIGTYFGIQASSNVASPMSHRPEAAATAKPVGPSEYGPASHNLEIVDALREAISTQRVFVTLANVQISLEPREFKLPNILQGDVAETSMTVSNTGASPAQIRLVPECGCLAATYKSLLAPGETERIRVRIDTSEYVGPFGKKFFFYSNDPEKTAIELPVKMWIEPRMRILDAQQRTVIVIPESGLSTSFYAVLGKDVKINVKDAQIIGTGGVASVTPWKGKIVDPLSGSLTPVEREGYKVSVLLGAESVVPGRSAFSVKLITDNDKLPTLERNFMIQRGIAAVPTSVYFGEVGSQAATAATLLSRPGQPFKVLGVKLDNSALTGSVENLGGDEYRLVIKYNGKGLSGELSAKAFVTTDSPDQKVIEVPISGQIK